MQIITLNQIKTILPSLELIPTIEAGFVAYSARTAVVPPVGELILDKGEVHIKYGFIKKDKYYVIKIASGFYHNPRLGLPSSNGLMILFDQNTGMPVCALLDEGFLTDIRTAIAGAIAAKYLAPPEIKRIGVVGTGVQARLQLLYLKHVTECRDVLVWGRGSGQLNRYKNELQESGFKIETTKDTKAVLQLCDLIVTATPSKEPLLKAKYLQSGVHITAVGSDTPFKQELEGNILQRADVIVADSISQCLERGEIFQALRSNHIKRDQVVELGHVITEQACGRSSPHQVTVADLTGVAVQDLAIATAVYEAVHPSSV
jgi:ornithine cyclodeaminase